jgi:hypothetical protein
MLGLERSIPLFIPFTKGDLFPMSRTSIDKSWQSWPVPIWWLRITFEILKL